MLKTSLLKTHVLLVPTCFFVWLLTQSHKSPAGIVVRAATSLILLSVMCHCKVVTGILLHPTCIQRHSYEYDILQCTYKILNYTIFLVTFGRNFGCQSNGITKNLFSELSYVQTGFLNPSTHSLCFWCGRTGLSIDLPLIGLNLIPVFFYQIPSFPATLIFNKLMQF